ncbi:TetR/AcrR family transcriptional regulator [Amycolatopsis sp. NPDC058278]|jgi:AcrR family transcriptional regulator|uniref:TetR/AcrR family transcriptional regulator n=1 Tax=unclassified Amycolatopsis TaxID=2618356 RepID=UPI00255C0CC3|nr:TetR/AcrR family transcriptional regulator [Amycolatopsis sp. DG1A-15b]WIX91669.1 TetR/AcrR family transcriptional regulator [Amycolatopsis sp. DG1A-15b]
MQVNPDLMAELGLSVTEAARRAQIIGATIGVLADLGYRRTTFAKIKERAGLSSTRLISYHFTNKAGLMQAVLSTVIQTKSAFLTERTGGGLDPADRPGYLRAHIETSIAFLRAYPECVRALTELAANADDADGWVMTKVLVDDLRVHGLARQLKQGQAEGLFGAFTPEVMAMSIAQAIDGVAAAYAADPSLDLETYGREVADTFVKATAP